jgi:hypothetical protein
VEARLRSLIRVLAVVLAVALVTLMAMLGLYLGGEDSYFGDGASRWSHRIAEPDNQATLWSAVALCLAALAALVYAVRSGRLRYAVGGAVLGTLGVVATTLTFVAFTAN